ncbi:hypothetical protein LOTGIDRAFT_169927 [Lottia gigantea]|uniref:C-type lectin domain-containing protein n=1 Tax=Lottia gigantea TaxID=225164 RepID=V3ZEG1_LOTGI|nr:hypothetical protein LOTGIDRAFT_169927 [Lottia gigantea]ESO82457.1 hypothetical protein LOTGIDRAFT_169927 [Lottia gigantea]
MVSKSNQLFRSMKQCVFLSTLLATSLMIVNADYWNRSIFNGTETVDKQHVVLACGLVECGLRCSNQHGCDHFFYSKEGDCYLISPRFLDIGSTLLTGISKYEYIPTGCPLIFKYLNDICFYVVDDPADKLQSDKSNIFCKIYDAQLMVIDSQTKHDTIVDYMDPGNTYLFGIYNILPNRSFDTTDNRKSEDIQYSNWKDGEPAGPFDKPNYGIIRTTAGGTNFTWKSGQKKIRYFICEKY